VPNFVPTTKPYCVRSSASFLCRGLSRNPTVPAHVGEDHSMSLRLVGRPLNARKVRINIAPARRSLSLCLVSCLSGRSTVTQEVAGLILATSANFLCLHQ
jgi:hypothetical protein